MRCLYCGNELALLKKLTGHGEFCSEAHRQKYQEQYNRLALTRLLQAQDAEPERRPLQPAGRPGTGTLGSGSDRKAVPPPPPQAPPPPALKPPMRSRDYPGLRGFLPHQFEPALSPAELFSPEPFLAAVTACLPSASSAPFSAGTADTAVDTSDMSCRRGLTDRLGGGRIPGSLREFEGQRPILLMLQRLESAPICDEGVQGYPFSAEFRETIAAVLTILDGIEFPTPRAVNGTNGANLHRILPSAERITEPVSTTPSFADSPESLPPEPGPQARPPDSTPVPSTATDLDRPAVVINLDALLGPAPPPPRVESATAVQVVVADNEEARRLLGWLDEELEELRTAPETVTPPILAQLEQPAVSLPPSQPEEAPAPILQNEPNPEPGPPLFEALTDSEPAPQLKPVPSVHPPAQPEREIVPAACLEYIEVRLELAGDAFGPINEAEFAGPDFQIQTPAIATAPLRAKVVFGPSPAAPSILPKPPDATGDVPDDVSGAAPHDSPPVSASAVTAEPPASAGPGTGRRADEILPPEPPQPATPAQTAARLRSMAALARKAQEDLAAPPPPLEPRPQVQPRRDSPPPAPAPRTEDSNLETLRLEMERMGTPVTAPSARSRRIAVAVGLLLAIVLIGYLIKQSFASRPPTAHRQSRLEAYGPSLVSGDAGWSLWTDRGSSGSFSQRQLYVFRPSLSMSDYRIEFKGEIETKGLGWFFRAANERNYYLMKLEMVRAGLTPKVMLTRTAVINGEETQKSQAELPMNVRLDTVYKVQTDVWNSTFKTYIQDQLVDTWVDDRLKTGGFGLLRDPGESSQVRLIQLHGLRLVAQ